MRLVKKFYHSHMAPVHILTLMNSPGRLPKLFGLFFLCILSSQSLHNLSLRHLRILSPENLHVFFQKFLPCRYLARLRRRSISVELSKFHYFPSTAAVIFLRIKRIRMPANFVMAHGALIPKLEVNVVIMACADLESGTFLRVSPPFLELSSMRGPTNLLNDPTRSMAHFVNKCGPKLVLSIHNFGPQYYCSCMLAPLLYERCRPSS
mmetsp:Transcript_29331/g.71488  ORF Transcript_29331/g.71488 Transcript_29331/m.71488 type:complete len:207 (-) Transcript_29331:526-1146(-)